MSKTIKQQNFWSGIVNDVRSSLPGAVSYAENFDVGRTKTLKQVVNNQAENSCSYDVNNYITKCIQVGTDIYGLGQDNNTNHDTTIWKKTNSLSSAWAIATNGTISSSTFNAGDALFVANNGIIYLDGGNSKIAKYTIATNVMSATAINLANAKDGVVWQGNVYCHSGQDIYQINTTSDVLTNKITIPSEQTIVAKIPFGNLMAILCTSTTTVSKMYLWDGVTTTTFMDIIEIGVGTVSGGCNLDGMILAVINTPNKRTLKIKGYNGGNFQNLFTYTGRSNQANTFNYIQGASRVQRFTGYAYFMITGTKPDDTYSGLYQYALVRYGREEPTNPMTFSVYKTFDFTSSRGLDGQTSNNDFTVIENIIGGADTAERSVAAFINSDTNKTTFFLSESNVYTNQPGVLETLIFNMGDSSITKTIEGISVQYKSLPSGGGVVAKYKKDEETYWTTVFLDTALNSISHEALLIENQSAVGTDTVTISIATPAVVTLTNHRLVPGQLIHFTTTSSLPTGITAGTDYYVISAGLTSSAFEISTTSGGSAVNTSGSQAGTQTIDRSAGLPTLKEGQLRIEGYGGVEITGWGIKYSVNTNVEL